MSMTPETIILDFGYTKLLKIIQENPNHFGNIFSKSQNLKIENVGKDACRKSLRSVLSILENLEYGINIFQKTWNGNLGFFNSIKGIPPTHPPFARSNQHSDSHPCIRVLAFEGQLIYRQCGSIKGQLNLAIVKLPRKLQWGTRCTFAWMLLRGSPSWRQRNYKWWERPALQRSVK